MFITPERKQQILDAAGSNLVEDDDPMDAYRSGYEAVYPNALKNKHIAEAYAAGMPVWQYGPAVSAKGIARNAALAWVVELDAMVSRTKTEQQAAGK